MTIEPKVSVIVPVFNAADYLAPCLDSLIAQTLKDVEIICVDDGSKDDSWQILQQYAKKDARITIIQQKNKGVGCARNQGIQLARGTYIGFVDADDWVDSDYFEKLYDAALKDNSDIAMTTNVREYSPKGCVRKMTGARAPAILSGVDEKGPVALISGIMWNKIYRRAFVEKFGLSCYAPPAYGHDDNYWTFLSVMWCNQISVVDGGYYFYRFVPNSLVHQSKSEKEFIWIEIYRAILDRVQKTVCEVGIKEKWINFLDARMRHDVRTFCAQFPKLKKSFLNYLKQHGGYIRPVIVSLTSYPPRIPTLCYTVESLLNQTQSADQVILWLSPEEFPHKEKDLPMSLLDLTKRGLSIEWYHDIKSYAKLIPVLQKCPKALIVTTDDDVIYQNTVLEKLLNSYIENPNMVHALRAHDVCFKRGRVALYSKWEQEIKSAHPSYNNFPTGIGGVLYPPESLHPDVLDEEKFQKLCPMADDVWFWAMAVHNGTKICLSNDAGNLYVVTPGTQDRDCLWMYNVTNGGNDKQLCSVFQAYPDILDRLDKKHHALKKFKLVIPLIQIKQTHKKSLVKILGVPVWRSKRRK